MQKRIWHRISSPTPTSSARLGFSGVFFTGRMAKDGSGMYEVCIAPYAPAISARFSHLSIDTCMCDRPFFLILKENLAPSACILRSTSTQCRCGHDQMWIHALCLPDLTPLLNFSRTTLYCLSKADVLLNAWSYFSHVATFLSEGIEGCDRIHVGISAHLPFRLQLWYDHNNIGPRRPPTRLFHALQAFKSSRTTWDLAHWCIWRSCAGETSDKTHLLQPNRTLEKDDQQLIHLSAHVCLQTRRLWFRGSSDQRVTFAVISSRRTIDHSGANT